MNARKDRARLAGWMMIAVMPLVAHAGGFDGFVVDDAEVEVAPFQEDSVLVPSPAMVAPDEGMVVDESPVWPTQTDVPCQTCGTLGCTSCCEIGGCTGGSSPSCCDVPGCTGCRPSSWHTAHGYFNRILGDASPRWVAQVDALMLWQGNIPSRVLFTDEESGASALNINDAQPAMSAGPRFGLFFNLDPVYSIEGNYFNVQSFQGEAITSVGEYQENDLAGYIVPGIDQAGVATSGGIQSAELNWRRRTCGPITWLAGFRWVEWNQDMVIVEDDDDVTYAYATTTGNDLYGGQMGADLCLWDNNNGPIRVNGVGKAGIFYNQARQQTGFTDFDEFAEVESAIADQTSFVGEVGVNASLRLTNWLSWRAGYVLFWLSAVATPADQLSATDIPEGTALINTNGSVLLHGVTTGLEARW